MKKNNAPRPMETNPTELQTEESPIELGRFLLAGGTVTALMIILILLRFVFKVF